MKRIVSPKQGWNFMSDPLAPKSLFRHSEMVENSSKIVGNGVANLAVDVLCGPFSSPWTPFVCINAVAMLEIEYYTHTENLSLGMVFLCGNKCCP